MKLFLTASRCTHWESIAFISPSSVFFPLLLPSVKLCLPVVFFFSSLFLAEKQNSEIQWQSLQQLRPSSSLAQCIYSLCVLSFVCSFSFYLLTFDISFLPSLFLNRFSDRTLQTPVLVSPPLPLYRWFWLAQYSALCHPPRTNQSLATIESVICFYYKHCQSKSLNKW